MDESAFTGARKRPDAHAQQASEERRVGMASDPGDRSGRSMLRRAADGWKAFRMAWSGTSGSSRPWNGEAGVGLPGSRFDYEAAAGDPVRNGAVSICLGWLADNFPEPELRVLRRGRSAAPGGSAAPVADHPLARLVESPNPFYDGDALWAATLVSYCVDGNAYWLKVRSAAGRVAELWYLPHWQIGPRWPADGSEFIRDYVYRVNGEERAVAREDVVHFRFGLDPDNPRLGMSRLRAVLREVCTDNDASTYTAALLRNMGIPSVLIAPADRETQIDPDTAAEMRRQWRARYGGEMRGEPLIPSIPLRIEKLNLTPEELALETLRHVPEARICAALRISPMVVGLSVGDIQRTFSNYATARRAAYEDCLMPLGRRMAAAPQRQLLPDLGDPRRERVGWDYTRVAALRDDLTAIYERNSIAVRGGWMTRAEARAAAGLPVGE